MSTKWEQMNDADLYWDTESNMYSHPQWSYQMCTLLSIVFH